MICIDANVMAKLLFEEEEHSDKATALIGACTQAMEIIVAPSLLPFEVTNIIRKRMRREGLELERARRVLAQFHSYPISLRSLLTLHDQALVVASEFGLAASYNAHYLVLARESSCNLWTADEKLLRSLRGRVSYVRSLADYSPFEAVQV